VSDGHPASHADPGVVVARAREDVVVGDRIVRHSLATRAIHWTTSALFLLCLLTGMPIWTPVFGWMAGFFGGLSVCRWLHPWLGVGYFLAALVMYAHWRREMVLEPDERGWMGRKMLEYMRYETDDSNVGKFNGGQKMFFWAVTLAAVGLATSGLVMWFPPTFPVILRKIAILLHDVTFVLLTVSIVFHVYLGTAAEPGTFASMTRGTVTKAWARLHHPRWLREVTGEGRREN